MKPYCFPLLLAGVLLAHPTHAQHAFQVGPTAGATLSTVHFAVPPAGATIPLRAGWQAGATGSWCPAGQWGGQLAVLFTQQGYTWHRDTLHSSVVDKVRLNYLRVPLHATFSQHAGGQGWQAFAGPYVGVLLGGSRTYEETYAGTTRSQTDRVVVADSHDAADSFSYSSYYQNVAPDYTYHSRRFDFGLQGGVGYRLGNALLQVGYTLGLRSLAATTVYTSGPSPYYYTGTAYRTRGWQASLTYLLGPKS